MVRLLAELNSRFPLLFASIVVLSISFVSMELASFVGLPRLVFFFLLFYEPPYRLLASYLIAYILFDRAIASLQVKLSVQLTGYVIIVSLACMFLFVGYIYHILVAPNLLSPISLDAALPAMLFYAVLPGLFLISLLRRKSERDRVEFRRS
ncbi:hypothetical protein [Bradyrhizobium sp. 153]|uniref:hypothetical protein n=1 Tax=Bradyrhizobium sp. 153 TaxID=2782627 RepID=UPI001FF7FBD0|nr:hypothetical protein [Bradyrhizobium sp. 153]MCK1665268.1 hypothetical protein [Bradyrhizobium sp. 153]